MKRRGILTLSTLVVAAAAAALPADGAGGTANASTQRVFKNGGCRSRVNFYSPETWACTTITVNPWQLDAGATTTVTYSVSAKRKLKYVTVCFSRFVNLASCAYTRNFRMLKRGQIIRHVVQLATPPNMPESGVWLLDNTTHFYKTWSKWASRSDPYWGAGSYVQALPAN